MQGSEPTGAQASASAAADLQSGGLQDPVPPGGCRLNDRYDSELASEHTDEELCRVDTDEEHTARLQVEHDLVEILRKEDFTGPVYRVLHESLASYDVAVVWAWIHRREIYRLLFEKGRPVRCPGYVRDHLARDAEDRQELAMDVVAETLDYSLEHALRGGVWSSEGGACLHTFFVGATLHVFPNRFRVWLRKFTEGRDHLPMHEIDFNIGGATDPADIVCCAGTVRTLLEALSLRSCGTRLKLSRSTAPRTTRLPAI